MDLKPEGFITLFSTPIIYISLIVTLIAFVLFGIVQRLAGKPGPKRNVIGHVESTTKGGNQIKSTVYEGSPPSITSFNCLEIIGMMFGAIFVLGALTFLLGFGIVGWQTSRPPLVGACCLVPIGAVVLAIVFIPLSKLFPGIW